jgi:tRNA (Thr-GGU) A37 N-methylase
LGRIEKVLLLLFQLRKRERWDEITYADRIKAARAESVAVFATSSKDLPNPTWLSADMTM